MEDRKKQMVDNYKKSLARVTEAKHAFVKKTLEALFKCDKAEYDSQEIERRSASTRLTWRPATRSSGGSTRRTSPMPARRWKTPTSASTDAPSTADATASAAP